MTTVLCISKPYAPPWRDSSKNLARELLRASPVASPELKFRVLTPPRPGLFAAHIIAEPLYAKAGDFAPGLQQNLRVLLRLLRDPKADIVHFFAAPNPRSAQVVRALRRLGLLRLPLVQSLCSLPDDDDKIRAGLFADALVVMSRHAQQRLADLGRPDTIYIPPSVRRPALKSQKQRDILRHKMGISSSDRVIVFAGDLEAERGAQHFVEAMPAVARSLENARFVMATRTKTAASRARLQVLRDRVNATGLSSRCQFLGEYRAMRSLLTCADVQVLTPHTLAQKMDYPLVLLEGFVRGLPAIVSSGTPLDELAQMEPGAVFALSAKDPAALSQRLIALCGDDKSLQRARQAAYALSALLTPDGMAQAYADLYRRLLK